MGYPVYCDISRDEMLYDPYTHEDIFKIEDDGISITEEFYGRINFKPNTNWQIPKDILKVYLDTIKEYGD